MGYLHAAMFLAPPAIALLGDPQLTTDLAGCLATYVGLGGLSPLRGSVMSAGCAVIGVPCADSLNMRSPEKALISRLRYYSF